MEDRFIIAASAGFALATVFIWIGFRKLEQRRKFKHRQMGRGKSIQPLHREAHID